MRSSRWLALIALAALSLAGTPVQAGVRIGLGISIPLFCPPRPRPVYVAPAPVYVVPPPAPYVVQPAPVVYQAQPVQVAPPAQPVPAR